MKTRHLLISLVVISAAAIAASVDAQAPAARGEAASSSVPLTAAQALPLTCAQSWIASGKSYARMRAVVIELAKVSLVNRDLKFPNQHEAGLDAGTAIAADCKADPHALLFAIVDKHVRRIAAGSPSASGIYFGGRGRS
jgi:hypothetical protein